MAWRYLVRAAAVVGLLQILVTTTPILRWWTRALSTAWGPGRGDTLVVLGSDLTGPAAMGISSYWRTFYTTLIWREGAFRRIIVSGKEVAPLMKDYLVCHGVPAEAVVVDNESGSTRENAVNISALLSADAANRHGPVVLLTSDYHMGRALGALRRAGVEASPLPYPDALKRIGDWPERWTVFLTLSSETAKSIFYRSKGWT